MILHGLIIIAKYKFRVTTILFFLHRSKKIPHRNSCIFKICCYHTTS